MHDNQIHEQGVLQPEIVDHLSFDKQERFFDVIFCEKPGVLGLLYGGIGIPKRNSWYKTIVCNFHYAMDAVKEMDVPEIVESNYFNNASMADGFLFACDDICNIDSFGQFQKKVTKYCSSSHISKCLAKPRWVKAATDYAEVTKKHSDWVDAGNTKPTDEFRIHYGYSLNKNFNFTSVKKLVSKYQLTNPNVKFVITTPSLGEGEKFESWTEFHGQCPRPKFFEIAQNSHVCVMWTEYDAGLNHGSVIEMTALGVLPVFYKHAIPFPWDGSYPFVFSNEVEFTAVMKSIQKNYDKPLIQDWLKKNKDLLDLTFQTRSGNDLVIDWVEKDQECKLLHKPVFCPWGVLLQDLEGDEYTMTDLVSHIKETSIVKADLNKVVAGTGRYRHGVKDNVRIWMLQNGWYDCGNALEPVFRRKHDG
jgi:hypothetical protein